MYFQTSRATGISLSTCRSPRDHRAQVRGHPVSSLQDERLDRVVVMGHRPHLFSGRCAEPACGVDTLAVGVHYLWSGCTTHYRRRTGRLGSQGRLSFGPESRGSVSTASSVRLSRKLIKSILSVSSSSKPLSSGLLFRFSLPTSFARPPAA